MTLSNYCKKGEIKMVKRKDVAVAIILTIVTCGLYGLYWFVSLTNDLNELTDKNGTSGGMALVFSLVTCGLYTFYWMFKSGEKVDILRRNRGESGEYTSIIYLVLALFGLSIVSYALIQDELNKNAQ